MSTVRQIAKRAGVSVGTVSRVLNDQPAVSPEARARVMAAVEKVNYLGTVGKRKPCAIAYVATSGPASIDSPYDVALLRGLATGLTDFSYDLTIIDARRAKRPHETYSQMLVRKGILGAILRTTNESREVCLRIAEAGFPAVVVGDELNHPDAHHVVVEQRDACLRAVQHLIGLGHRRIALAVNVVADRDHEERTAAYEHALSEAGIDPDPRWRFRVPATREGGGSLLRELMQVPQRPTAVFLADPLPALGLLRAALEQGVRIPDDLSVIGFDDARQRFDAFPTLSAVCQDAEALGRAAFDALQACIERKRHTRATTELACWLELHGTTAGPPAT